MPSLPHLTLLALISAFASGCGASPPLARGVGGGSTPRSTLAPPAAITVIPADGARQVRPDQPILVSASNGTLSSVSVSSGGQAVVGVSRPDGGQWTSSDPLLPSHRYAVHAVASGPGGSTSVVATFDTVAGRDLTATVAPDQSQTVGVAMPIVVRFNAPIPEDRQVELIKHVTVSANPPAVGAWHWWSLTEAHYRPEQFWKAGTTVTLTADLRGVPGAEGTWGSRIITHAFAVGAKHVTTIDDATHIATVTSNDAVTATYPVSLGKAGFPTIGGTLWVRYKQQKVKMNSCLTFGGAACVPGNANYYDEYVYWDTAVSTNGFFFHAAPWSVADQGVRDVSHGCVNASPSAAQTFFNFSQVGDAVVVKNTTRVADEGDGEGDGLRVKEATTL